MSMSSWAQRLRGTPAPAVDVAVAVVMTILMILAINGSPEPDAKSPDAVAYTLGVLFAATLVVRRRWPVAVLIVSSSILTLYLTLDYPAVPPALVLSVALYTAAAAGHVGWSLIISIVTVGGEVAARLFLEPEPSGGVIGDALIDASLMTTVTLLGEAVRSRRAWMAEVQERMRRSEADREREAERRVTEERLRIARELHDVMAHTIAVVTVQAGVATDVLDDHPDEARAALRTIRQAAREAMNELKAVVGVLRDSEGDATPRAPAPGLAQVHSLLGTAAAAGLRVDLTESGEVRPLPAAIDLTAYRIVQESLTNVVRHAEASKAAVAVRYEPDALVIEVTDDGRGMGGPGAAGGPEKADADPARHGLAGMAERTTAVGGRLEAGPDPAGGFRVWARLPTGRSRT